MLKKITNHSFVRFLAVGGSGFLLNIFVTVILAEFIVGRENYLIAFIAGILVNITFNFFAYWRFAFKQIAKQRWKRVFFFVYSAIITLVQLGSTKLLVNFLGVHWYALAICVVVGIISILNYLVFRNFIFTEH